MYYYLQDLTVARKSTNVILNHVIIMQHVLMDSAISPVSVSQDTQVGLLIPYMIWAE